MDKSIDAPYKSITNYKSAEDERRRERTQLANIRNPSIVTLRMKNTECSSRGKKTIQLGEGKLNIQMQIQTTDKQ